MVTESIFNELFGSFGSVPARYSCKLVKPSPSGSGFGVALGSLMDGKYCSSHASGNPSPSVSPGAVTALGAPADCGCVIWCGRCSGDPRQPFCWQGYPVACFGS